jgi:hypothetical protein
VELDLDKIAVDEVWIAYGCAFGCSFLGTALGKWKRGDEGDAEGAAALVVEDIEERASDYIIQVLSYLLLLRYSDFQKSWFLLD